MAGDNAVDVFGLDGDGLARVAARIGALTTDELATRPESLPEVPSSSNAFRGQAGPRLEEPLII
jgi:hypothetical protein